MLKFKQRLHPHQGFTFIEALIAFMVLSISIVGVVTMQAVSKKSSFDAMQRSLATVLANDIIQRMRVNTAAVTANCYSGTYSVDTIETSHAKGPCLTDLDQWKRALFGADVTQSGGNVGGLVNSTACISHTQGAVSVVIAFSGRTKTSDAASSKAEGSLAATCGDANSQRRQVYIDTFIY